LEEFLAVDEVVVVLRVGLHGLLMMFAAVWHDTRRIASRHESTAGASRTIWPVGVGVDRWMDELKFANAKPVGFT
jgi:hypothetical protein